MLTASVFCASSPFCSKEYLDSAYHFGKLLAKENIKILYGGGKTGLMGELAKGAKSVNGRIHGIIPSDMHQKGLGNNEVDELIITENIDERKKLLITKADLIFVLPGGIGTLEELFQALSWKYLQLIDIPIIIINHNNYFKEQIAMLDKLVIESFMNDSFKNLYQVVESVDEAMQLLKSVNPSSNIIKDTLYTS